MPHAFQQFINTRSTTRQLLIFVPTISLLEKVRSFCPAETVHAGGDPDRKEKVNLFREKRLIY
ncbi:hypothetical protein JCM21714_4278 [Gracilibacillus boraciitolerans JCM 21714]|uniref:ATP-dependent RNA helicase n=1 Tax=Gracilibacillus boraciitolerans JCM 21714 TaxID=1298598 RepID=W4VNW1_9BACI|nr:hypothetical protein [Gracilibacillus boraciitolerans]GAE95070.1 hypothetical protein JCM21714_4278 [Gracilibacillus boraciitolerans JCM 21714]